MTVETDRQDWFTAAMSREPVRVPVVEPAPVIAPEPECESVPVSEEPSRVQRRPGAAAESTPAVEHPAVERQRISGDPGARRVLIGLAVALVVAVVLVVATVVAFSHAEPAPAAEQPVIAPPAVVPVSPVAAPGVNPAAPQQDQAIPFTAAAACPAGSTSAQSLAPGNGAGVWVCVRGPQGARVDGQVLHVDFGGSYVISAVSVTPGWVAAAGGRDEWLQHRVVSRLQYLFNDPDRTVWTQQTGNAHGPVTSPLPHRVLASAATVVILQTARPPAAPPPAEAGVGAAPGFGDSVLGAGQLPIPGDVAVTAGPESTGEDADPVDATFAVSGLSFFGHQPN